MKHLIFDREKDDVLRDEDGDRMYFDNSRAIWEYLSKDCQFKSEWIKENFFCLRASKILIPDEEIGQPVDHKTDEYKKDKYKHIAAVIYGSIAAIGIIALLSKCS